MKTAFDPIPLLGMRTSQVDVALHQCGLDSLGFSTYGKYILVRSAEDVDVVTIPPGLYDYARNENEPAVSSSSVTTARDARGPLNDSHQLLTGTTLKPGDILDTTQLLAGTRESRTEFVLLKSNQNAVEIEHMSSSETLSQDRNVQLLSLPSSFDMRNYTVSFQIPANTDKMVRIQFNTNPSDRYSLSRNERTMAPYIAEKSLTSIQLANEILHMGYGTARVRKFESDSWPSARRQKKNDSELSSP